MNYSKYKYRDPILVRERGFREAIKNRFPKWYRFDLRSVSYSVLKQILDELDLAMNEIRLTIPERDSLEIKIAQIDSKIKQMEANEMERWAQGCRQRRADSGFIAMFFDTNRSQENKELPAIHAKIKEDIAPLIDQRRRLDDRKSLLGRLVYDLELFEWYRGKVEPIAIRRKDTEDAWNELRNRAAQNSTQIRDAAHIIKDRIKAQHCCPYCGGHLGESPHADHIYPVSKGGRSTERNMVYVCARCNEDKSDLTLSAFIRHYNLDRDAIEARLSRMGKDF